MIPFRLWSVVALSVCVVSGAAGQKRPTIAMYQVTPESATAKIASLMAAYGFVVVNSGKKRMILQLDRGTVPQVASGPIKVYLEVVMDLKQNGDSLVVMVAEETLVGMRAPSLEQRKPQDLRRNYTAYMTTLTQAKQALEPQGASTPADSSVITAPMGDP